VVFKLMRNRVLSRRPRPPRIQHPPSWALALERRFSEALEALKSVPAPEHESCARKFAEVQERLEKLELARVEQQLQVMDVAEKVAEKLAERVRKRKPKEEDGDDIDRLIALRRGHVLGGQG
jgi:signal recognition particle GTPase